MKPVIAIIVFLFFALTSSVSYSHSIDNNCYHHVDACTIKKHCTITLSSPALQINSTSITCNAQQDILCIEEDEPDEDDRFVTTAPLYFEKTNNTINDQNSIVLNDLYHSRYFFYAATCKYITLRVLRI